MRALAILLLLALLSSASNSSLGLEVKILEKVINEISINKEKVVWSDSKKLCDAFKKKDDIRTSSECKDATILILKDSQKLPKECSNSIIFVLDYALLSKMKNSFGAFFWKKGRPNIVILKSRLKSLSIKSSKHLDPYLEEKAW